MVTVIDDREGDIYEKFVTPRADHVHLLGRADHNRVMSDGVKLFDSDGGVAPCRGAVNPCSGQGRPARPMAQTRVSWQEVEFARPRFGHDVKRLQPKVKLRAVQVEEVDPPEGVKAILWLLLTTHPVASLADALQIVSWYRARWTIEQVFRTMKSQGFVVEDSQIETPEVMSKLILAVLIASLRTLQLVYARSGMTGQKLSDAIDAATEPLVERLSAKLEGKTAKLKNPARQRHARALLLGDRPIGRMGRLRRPRL